MTHVETTFVVSVALLVSGSLLSIALSLIKVVDSLADIVRHMQNRRQSSPAR